MPEPSFIEAALEPSRPRTPVSDSSQSRTGFSGKALPPFKGASQSLLPHDSVQPALAFSIRRPHHGCWPWGQVWPYYWVHPCPGALLQALGYHGVLQAQQAIGVSLHLPATEHPWGIGWVEWVKGCQGRVQTVELFLQMASWRFCVTSGNFAFSRYMEQACNDVKIQRAVPCGYCCCVMGILWS